MDPLTSYRFKIKAVLSDYAAFVKRTTTANEIDTLCLFDEEHDTYMVYRVGWDRSQRVRTTSILIRIVDGKVWLEEDWTPIEVAHQLREKGIPPDAISLGFIHPAIREEATTAVA